MGLKEDSKFARFITMGAVGAEKVAGDLISRGHQVVELERYAMANKIWTTKVKRLRMADLLCINCGRRFEAKAKSNLEVKLSDSAQPGRDWAAGMRDDDVFAFLRVVVDENSRPIVIGDPLYLVTRDMRSVEPKQGGLKSAADGSERDIYWPITVAKRNGTVTLVQDGKVRIRDAAGRVSTLGRPSNVPLVSAGDLVVEGQALGTTVAPAADITCHGSTWDVIGALTSSDEVEVFAAVKAAGLMPVDGTLKIINSIAGDEGRDMRLRIEAWGALARLGDLSAIDHLADLRGSESDPAMQMERILVLSELLETAEAADHLFELASQDDLSDELRAAAVWGLGSAWHDDFSRVWTFVYDTRIKVRRHAQASLGMPHKNDIPRLIAELASPITGPFAAATLARASATNELIQAAHEPKTREWALQALGQCPPESTLTVFDELATDDYRVVEALWRRNQSDSHNEPTNLTELQFLSGQSIGSSRRLREITKKDPPSTCVLQS